MKDGRCVMVRLDADIADGKSDMMKTIVRLNEDCPAETQGGQGERVAYGQVVTLGG